MKFVSVISVISLLLLLSSCSRPVPAETTTPTETTVCAETEAAVIPTDTFPLPTVPETTAPPVPVVELTEEEQTMLLKLGMAERGSSGCTECIALVMRSVLNRVESGNFSSIRSVIFAQDQYTPVWDGTYDSAQPNDQCYEALEMIIYGWDESQGAQFYEWCAGESWHSKNLHLLFQHCDTRFYD